MSVRETLRGLPRFGSPGNAGAVSARIMFAKNPVLRRSPYAGMLFNGSGRPLHLARPAPTLPASMGGNRTPIIDQAELESGASPWIVDYHSSLQRGESPLGGEAPDRLRRLTLEEAAALQGFPIGTGFMGSKSSKFCQIGNSVPPALAAAVAHGMVRVLESMRPKRKVA